MFGKNRKVNSKKNVISDVKAVLTSCKVDILDILLNTIAVLATGSVVMLAEVLQGFSDLTVDVLTYIGIKRSKKPANEKYPLGFGRELYIWALFSTIVMLLVLAGMSFYFGWQRFLRPESIKYLYLVYSILILSLFSNGYSFSLGARRILNGKPFWKIRKAINESTFLETKITFFSDLMGFLAAFFGLVALILFKITGNFIFDGLGAMFIAFLMACFAISLFKNVRDFIVGVSASEETKEQIEEAALAISGVRDVLDLKAIVIGSDRLLVNLEIHIAEDLMTEDIEKLIDKVKANIQEKVPSSMHIQVEIETP